jgi:phosphoribosyl-dephospho-CoA transferase
MGSRVHEDPIAAQMGCRRLGSLNRHDLIHLNAVGRRIIATELGHSQVRSSAGGSTCVEIPPKWISMFTGVSGGFTIPGIVRRWYDSPAEQRCSDSAGARDYESEVPVGFVIPVLFHGRKLRLATTVPRCCVDQVTSPFEVFMKDFKPRTRALSALAELRERSSSKAVAGLRIGVWGSCALEIYTGLPYTNDASDLDLLLEADSYERLVEAVSWLEGQSHDMGVRLDMEARLPGGWGVNARELVGSSQTVLAKSIHGVGLLPRNRVLAMFAEMARS